MELATISRKGLKMRVDRNIFSDTPRPTATMSFKITFPLLYISLGLRGSPVNILHNHQHSGAQRAKGRTPEPSRNYCSYPLLQSLIL